MQREEGDLARREDAQRRPPEAGTAAGVELGALAVAGQPAQYRLVEADDTGKIFSNPTQKATEDYISGRFG